MAVFLQVSKSVAVKTFQKLWDWPLKIFCSELPTGRCALRWLVASIVAWGLFLCVFLGVYHGAQEAAPFMIIPVVITFVFSYVFVAYIIELKANP